MATTAAAIERLFHLREQGSDVRTEVVGGATTFVALSYIIFVNPAVLSTTGMDAGAVMVATCLSAAFATTLMGLWANYPIAVAPAMGRAMMRSPANDANIPTRTHPL